jgi:subtilisin family serine protease/subtilisin-like proprotein convertase family protein
MKSSLAGLLAAGLLVVDGRADPGRVRLAGFRVGGEWLVPAIGEAATRAAGVEYPVLHEAGTEPSALTRRIVTGRISVRLHLDGAGVAEMAGGLAGDHGLVDEGVAEGAAPWRLFRADPPAHALEAVDALRADPRVAEAEVVLARQMARRDLPDDPLLPYQWHLKNLLPTADGGAPADLGVEAAWGAFTSDTAGWRGRGVRLGIIDDGIEYAHPEFAGGRLDAAAGRNWNGGPTAAAQGPADSHGTAVAGLAAASADNALGVAGVAPAAGLVSLRLTAAAHDDSEEAQALGYLANPRTGANAAALIHVKNASWGPADGTFRLAGPGPLARQALANAVRDGRGGRGTVFVWAAGNGGALGEDANADGYANNPHVIAVGAMDSDGLVPDYSEGGACVAVVAPSASETGLPMVTADRTGRAGFNPPVNGDDLDDVAFTSGFGGTSAAAPLVAGVCALMLEANPALGWRDVKEILVRSARRVHPDSKAWITNAAGLRFHPLQGAGLVDAAAATAMAASWTPLGPQLELRQNAMQPAAIPDVSEAGLIRRFEVSQRRRVEHVLLRFSANHPYRGDLKLTLTSPSGTASVLAPSYFTASPTGQANYDQWVFSSLHFWGESSAGTWTLRVADVLAEETGRFLGAELTLLAADPLPAPVFTSAAAGTAAMSESFVHALTVTHGPAVFSVTGGLPPGLAFDPATGTLRGRPTRAGVFVLTFEAAGPGGTAIQAFELKVTGLYESWIASHRVAADASAPGDDPDFDDRPNLEEYAVGGNPLSPEAPEFPRCLAGADHAPIISFLRQPARSDVVWQIQHSIDGLVWTAVAESRGGQPAASLVAERFALTESAQPEGGVVVALTDTAKPSPTHGWFRLRLVLEP